MNKVQIKRLKSVVIALRDAQKVPIFRKLFTMRHWGWQNTNSGEVDTNNDEYADCGTPACAMGHYAVRTDLQRTFDLNNEGQLCLAGMIDSASMGAEICSHFGIDSDEQDELFGTVGCDEAETPKAAAKYINRFIKRKEKEHARA